MTFGLRKKGWRITERTDCMEQSRCKGKGKVVRMLNWAPRNEDIGEVEV
jgi:hypothetical protein